MAGIRIKQLDSTLTLSGGSFLASDGTDWVASVRKQRNSIVINTKDNYPGTALFTDTWVTNNKALFIPFRVETAMTAKRIGFMAGNASSGNIDIGIYDTDGNRLVSFGSFASSGSSRTQIKDITDTALTASTYYYAALVCSSTTMQMMTLRAGESSDLRRRLYGIKEQNNAFPLPEVASFSDPGTGSTNKVPMLIILGSA